MSYDKPQMVAGGDIRRARFVKLSTAADYTLLEADANERIMGISMDAAQDAPLPSADDDAADATDSFNWFGAGEVAQIELGTGGCTRGGLLKSDADGKGVAAATTGATMQWIGAEAIESGLEGEKVRVVVRSYPHYPALS